MKLTSIDNLNPDYLQEIKTLLIKCEDYLIRLHKGNKKYVAHPTDIKYQYNHVCCDYDLPTITTKIVVELLKEVLL